MKLKINIDVLMTAALLFLMPYELVGRAAHEWIGTDIIICIFDNLIIKEKT